ncbi:MAG: LysE family transporter [Anaerovoracaceae bacterium]|jgi:L-lysine exporter family protein LysE/ArgO|nr:LysE family transporter [Anaerovoracaceae bacterium]
MVVFLQGLTMGIAYVAPIGLQNLFVINTALTQTRGRVYATALIVVFFDITLALACFFGIGLLIERWMPLRIGILLVGSLLVLWIGINLIRTRSTLDTSKSVNIPLLKVIWSACVVTWFNPQAIIDGTMMLGAFRAALDPSMSQFFILGVAVASTLWFLGISTLITFFSTKFTDKTLNWINIICGIIIVFYGIRLFVGFLVLIKDYL